MFREIARSHHESQLIYFDEVWQCNKGGKPERKIQVEGKNMKTNSDIQWEANGNFW